MKKKSVFCVVVTLVLLVASIVTCFAASAGFEPLLYPEEALTVFSPDMLSRISSGDDHLSNRGYDETGLYRSPYWTMTVNGEPVPVYATPVYDWALNTGVLQSYEVLFLNEGASLDIRLTFSEGAIKNAVVLPEKLHTEARISGDTLISSITRPGAYTFLINDDSQKYAVTLFVKENTDEAAEIAALTEKYGAENIEVYEKGVYAPETLPTDKDCLYFKRGAFLSFRHIADIRSNEDAADWSSYPVMELNGKNNALVTGCGTFDFTKIDRGERTLLCVDFCKNTTVEGLICLNPNSWTLTVYGSEDCVVNDITVFGYRTNSDGVNIGGCHGITVKNSFCRNGDDCFSVKATNTDFDCHDVTFTECVGWSNKARCFGITGEVERDIYDVRFSDCAVIVRNAVWDMDRTGSLVVAVETGAGDVKNVTFENIEIYKDTGRPIYCMVYGDDIRDCRVSGVRFGNIRMNADGKIKISSQRTISRFGKLCAKLNNTFLGKIKLFSDFFGRFYNATNLVEVGFENVTLNGRKLSAVRAGNFDAFGNARIDIRPSSVIC